FQSKVCEYHGAKMGSQEPHVFALAEAAYSSLQNLDVNQSCVISGESGAGKTETTKFILQYLCSPNMKKSPDDYDSKLVLDQLKYLGMLDIIRIRREGYPVHLPFVEFLNRYRCLVNKELAETLKLRPVEHYKYLNQSGCVRIEGVSDARKFDALRLAFNVLRIPLHMCEGIFKVLSAILWLGNTVFQDIDGEKCKLANEDSEILNIVAELLGLQFEDVVQVVLRRQINVRGNITEIPLKLQEGSDSAYLVNLHSEFEPHPCYVKGEDRRRWELEFGIVHYAGSVTYTVAGFVDKNRDVTQDVFFDFMSRSTNEFVGELTKYQDLLGTTVARMGQGANTTARGTSKGKPTVGDTFRHQLQALVEVLQATNPWYVRCIKPNMKKSPDDYDSKLVLDQLKYLGMLDIIRIRREGYPVHLPFVEFLNRYRCLVRGHLPKSCQEAIQVPKVLSTAYHLIPQSSFGVPPDIKVVWFGLESVIQQELEGLHEMNENNNIVSPPTKIINKTPSLPEPTGPPPPPPQSQPDEPIYESVLPRDETAQPIPDPPAPVMNKLRAKSPGVDRIVKSNHVSANPSPKNSRPNSRSSNASGGQTWRHTEDAEREQRRKFRVEKKLQEMEEEREEKAPIDPLQVDAYHDLVEFAQEHFNNHERSPEGTIIATLTRKRKSLEMIPKYEMVTYYKGSSIPTSHMHMYDPDNVNLACTVFRIIVHVSCRQLPPSSVEVAAMKKLGTIVCRFFFLDGRTKAIDVHPTDTAGDAAQKLADKLGLRNLDGWAIYQSQADGEEHVRGHHYLYDVIAQWEIKQNKTTTSSGFASLGRRSSSNAGVGAGENRFIFKRRLFKSSREISQDPVEVNLLYAQAVHHVVKCDDFPVSEKVALQLAGLQAQVALGDPRDVRLDYYTDIDTFLPYRVSRSRGEDVWVPIIAEAHRQYGAGRSEMMAKVLYLSCVMQYPLYGTTMFSVTYRGYWSYGNDLILGVNWEGLMLIKPEDKFVLYEFRYVDIESLFLDPSDSFITVNLIDQGSHRCFVFETAQKTEIGSLIISYYPALAAWITEQEAPAKAITNEDRLRLYNNVVNCRRLLVNGDLLKKPQDSASNFIRNTLRRLSKNRLEKMRLEYGGLEQSETYKGFSYSFWAFSRQCIAQSLSRLPEPEEVIALQMFNIILTYAGLGQNGESVRRAEDEHLSLVQGVMERAMRKDSLLTELYLQLIKQTTDHPDPNSRVNLRHWALLCLACSVVLPAHRLVRKYLVAHLKRCSSDCVSEEGKYARFAEKCVLKTQGTRRRQWPPSREEILCTINRRPIYARFYFMDGSYHAVEFHPSATARDAVALIRAKLGLRDGALGYAIYEVLGSSERSLVADEKVADVMSKWERYRNASAAQNTQKTPSRKQTHAFLFKKHLFLDAYMDLDDPVEKELLYHQVLHGLRSDRFPVSEKEAVMLSALQAQVELGDCPDHLQDYRQVAAHCLPPRLVPALSSEGVYMHHQSLRGMTPAEAKKAFLNLIRSWPLHRATIFDVMQSFTSNWPRVLWLAVDQVGLHLLEHRSRNALVTYEYESVLSYSPALNCLMIITGSDRKQSKVILTTSQAFQIANLIREYTEVLQSPNEVRKRDNSKGNTNRPLSILHKPAPVIEPQPS
ncbi:myosin-VIIa, partial [Diaphorina citri]|uniref:Myosin-VIIa n=2 Tax=Diaphorina citri TaxID=121845 RepID=A0A3Q0IN12_DIACI